MTYVTCPILRYRPAVVAQQAATLQLLSDGRFTLGLGAGENLNEHVIGEGWPPVAVRHEMFAEAVQIIKELLAGDGYTDLPRSVLRRRRRQDLGPARGRRADRHRGVRGAVGRAGRRVRRRADRHRAQARARPRCSTQAGGGSKDRVGQLPISYGTDKAAAVTRAHQLFRWFGLGWKVNADLPGTAGFDAASQFVREEDVASGIPCGDDVEAVIEAGQGVRRGRVHPPGAGADRRRPAGALPGVDPARADACLARGLRLLTQGPDPGFRYRKPGSDAGRGRRGGRGRGGPAGRSRPARTVNSRPASGWAARAASSSPCTEVLITSRSPAKAQLVVFCTPGTSTTASSSPAGEYRRTWPPPHSAVQTHPSSSTVSPSATPSGSSVKSRSTRRSPNCPRARS